MPGVALASAVARNGELAAALLATSRTRTMTSSSASCVEGLTFESSALRSQTAALALPLAAGAAKSQVTNETSGYAVGQELLWVERRNVGGDLGNRQRKIAGDADEGTRAHQLAIAHVRGDRHAQRLP